MLTIGTTGHRPQKLGGFGSKSIGLIYDKARECVEDQISKNGKEIKFITGMALGWDIGIAHACVAKKIPFIAAVPFIGQEKVWPDQSKKEWKELIEQAEKIVIVADAVAVVSIPLALKKRNCWIVDNCSIMTALWNGEKNGGTWHAVNYAQEKGRKVFNYYSK